VTLEFNDSVHLVQQLYKSLATLSKVTRGIVLPDIDIIHLAENLP